MLSTNILNKEYIESLWREFEDVPMDPKTECIDVDWRYWKAGTFIEDIWHWFDEIYPGGVSELM